MASSLGNSVRKQSGPRPGRPALAVLTALGFAAAGAPAPASAHQPAVAGAVVGAGTGAVIGQAMGGRDGAVIGTMIGAVAGAAIASATVVSDGRRHGYHVHGGHRPNPPRYQPPHYRYSPPLYEPPPRVIVPPPVILVPSGPSLPPGVWRASPGRYPPGRIAQGYWQDGFDSWGRPTRTWITVDPRYDPRWR